MSEVYLNTHPLVEAARVFSALGGWLVPSDACDWTRHDDGSWSVARAPWRAPLPQFFEAAPSPTPASVPSSPLPDLAAGDWIRVAAEWRRLDGERPAERVEGRCEGYGCDTGCVGYVVYVVRGETEEQHGRFFFVSRDALREGEKLGATLGLPVVFEKDWDA